MCKTEGRYISSVRRYTLMSQKMEGLFSKKNAGRIKRIMIFGMLFMNIVFLSCLQHSSPYAENFPSIIIHFDSKEEIKEFNPIRITDEFTTRSGDKWYVSHYFLLFSEDFLHRADIEGVTVLMHELTEDLVAAYWQYSWLVIKKYTKAEIQDGLHVYLECGTHTFLPEPGNAGKTADGMPMGLEETTLLSILETLGRDVPPHGPTDGTIVVDTIDWKDVSCSLNQGTRKMENWLEEEGASGFPRTLRLEPLKSFSDSGNYQYVIGSTTSILDIRSTLHPGEKEGYIPGQLTYISENMDLTQEGNWLTFQYILKTGAAGPGEKTADLGSSEAASLVYFLTGLTLSNDALWVNLNPWEPERIVTNKAGSTRIGEVMLEADLQMKRDFCKYEDPCESDIGEEYWHLLDRKREELVMDCMKKYPQEIQDSDNVFFSAATRHWIVPAKITAYEDEDEIYIAEAALDIYSEPVFEHSTFEIANKPGSISNNCQRWLTEAAKEYGQYAMEQEKSLILPLVVKEVNTGHQYADLRQVYTSLILAQWYKSHGEQCLFSEFINAENVEYLISWKGRDSKEIWDEYVESYREGEYYCEKTEEEGAYIVKKIYSGGGINFTELISYLSVLGDIPLAYKELLSTTPSTSLVEDGVHFGDIVKILFDETEHSAYARNPVIFLFITSGGIQQVTDIHSILVCEITVVAAMWLNHENLRKKFTENYTGKCRLETHDKEDRFPSDHQVIRW